MREQMEREREALEAAAGGARKPLLPMLPGAGLKPGMPALRARPTPGVRTAPGADQVKGVPAPRRESPRQGSPSTPKK
jgi:hypothetical protein